MRPRTSIPALHWVVALLLLFGFSAWGILVAEEGPPTQKQIDEAIKKGQACLLKALTPEEKKAVAETVRKTQSQFGTGLEHRYQDRAIHLVAYALITSGIPREQTAVKSLLDQVAEKIQKGEEQTYDLALSILALTAGLSKEEEDRYTGGGKLPYQNELIQAVERLVKNQLPNGCWSYLHNRESVRLGDLSNAQFAVLGLGVAQQYKQLKTHIPRDTWQSVQEGFQSWFSEENSPSAGKPVDAGPKEQKDLKGTSKGGATKRKSYGKTGGWGYFPRSSGSLTGSMTCAGICSLILAQGVLSKRPLDKVDPISIQQIPPALKYLETEDLSKTFNQTPDATKAQKIMHYSHYHLYSLERTGALCRMERIGDFPWYENGARFLLDTQKDDGGWISTYGKSVDTSFALLFLSRATQRTYKTYSVGSEARGQEVGDEIQAEASAEPKEPDEPDPANVKPLPPPPVQ